LRDRTRRTPRTRRETDENSRESRERTAVEMRAYENDASESIADVASDSEVSLSSEEDSESRFARNDVAEFTWRCEEFEKYKTRGEKCHSDVFELGDTTFRLLLFPSGSEGAKGGAGDDASVSLFLDTTDRPSVKDYQYGEPWKRCAKFKLWLVHPSGDASLDEVKETSHAFTEKESDWGFNSFITRKALVQRGFVDESGGVTFAVRVAPCMEYEVDSRGVNNSYFNEYDSRKETGLIGLKNQGATCYMNSLLQTLYHIPSFRRAVYHMPTNESEEANSSMPLALQSVFYRLQYAPEGAVSTNDLTRSFGWDSYDSFMQHDVQELNRVLQDKLEEQMKQTSVEGTIQKLFEGHTTNFIECINVDYKSERKEEFLDLQLDVKGCKDIYASFDRYTEVEKLDGENKYRAEGHGLQDARKGVLFHDFPPVLQIQLKRFEYDFHRDTMVKIHDKYEFPEELDLDIGDRKYLVPEADKSIRNKYKLHSVLVHSGGINGGHYYAFIKPDLQSGDGQWFKFDDEHVTKESSEKAIVEQYGSGGTSAADSDMDGDDDMTNMRIAPNLRYTKVSSAYMLVYIRESDMDQIMCEANKTHLTEHLQARFAKEQRLKEIKRLEEAEAHLYTVIRVMHRKDLEANIHEDKFFDLGKFDNAHRFRLPKKTTFGKFKAQVASELGVPVDKQRFWLYSPRRNKTNRPHSILPVASDQVQVEQIRQKFASKNSATSELKLYLEEITEDYAEINAEHDICLHVKFYNPHEARLSYAGHIYAHCDALLTAYFPQLRALCGMPAGADIALFEEISCVRESAMQVDKFAPEMLERRPLGETSGATENLQLNNGDIIIVQPAVTGKMEAELMFPDAQAYMSYRYNQQFVTFRELSAPKIDVQTVEMMKAASYDQVAEALAKAIGLRNPQLLRFTSHNLYTNGPRTMSFKFRGADTLMQMLDNQTDILYYEVLDIPLPQLEQLKTLKVSFHAPNTKLVEEFQLRLPKNATVGDVLNELKSKLGDKVKGRKIRLLELFYSQIYKVFDEDKDIADINDQYWTLRAEEVPDEDIDRPNASLLRVYNVSKDVSNPSQYHAYDEPFLLSVSQTETLGQVKQRIKEKLEVSDEDFAKWKFLQGVSNRYDLITDEDDVLVSSRFTRMDKEGFLESCLGLERDVKGPRRPASRQSKAAGFERAIKIM